MKSLQRGNEVIGFEGLGKVVQGLLHFLEPQDDR